MKIQPGIGIVCNNIHGTLGLIVTREDKPNKLYLLSCWHVLDGGHRQSEVRLAGDDNRVIAHYQRSRETAHRDFDAALAEIDTDVDLPLSNEIFGTEHTLSRAAYSRNNLVLRKTGATTGNTRCVLKRRTSQYGDLKSGLILAEHSSGQHIYCKPGDSGAIWCSVTSGKAIGLHARGRLEGNLAAAAPVKKILKAFKADIATEADFDR